MIRAGADNLVNEDERPQVPDSGLVNSPWQDQAPILAKPESQKRLTLERDGQINFSQQESIYQPKQTAKQIEIGTKSWPEEGISAQFEKITFKDKTRTEKYTLNMSAEAQAAGQFEHMVKQFDKSGKLVAKATNDHTGNHIVLGDIQNGSPQSITIDKSDGTHVELNKGSSYFKMAGTWSDKSGAGPVVWQGDHLVYKDKDGNITSTDRFDPHRAGHIAFELSADKLDLDTGKATRIEADGSKTIMSFSPGRRDTVATDGSISGTVDTVDKAGKRTAVEISHQDSVGNVSIINVENNSVITLEGNKIAFLVDAKTELSAEKKASQSFSENLSEIEQAYIASHPEASRRGIAQLHVRLHDKPEELAKVYQSLNKLDDVQNLSTAEKTALKESALHNLAYPAEISQGQSGTCYAAAPERVLATAQPAQYINIINEAISTNRVTTNGAGPEIKELNPTVLHQKDSSGRNIASRIFQTTFSEVGFALKPPVQSPINETYSTVDYSSGTYRNTKDGLGVLLNPDGTTQTYPGMDLMQVTDTLNRLSAPDHPGYKLNVAHDSDSLYRAFKANGGQPMISAIDRASAPFGGKTHNPGDTTNHVVTIGAMAPIENVDGARYKTTFQMNGGAADDVTTDDTRHMTNVTSISNKGIKPTVLYISERS